ncbi:hypothetical protein [Dactylosporangium darangshiense]|uniref:hypothetical protein n=1 Tax=Dactylosporangium darangshiense TaxID=579108 RepID=UPI003642CB36
MTTATHAGQVLPDHRTLVVDLRTDYQLLVGRRNFHEYVRERIAAGTADTDRTTDRVELGRIVVIDRAGDLFAHSDALAMVLNAQTVRHVICVAVGMADGDGGSPCGCRPSCATSPRRCCGSATSAASAGTRAKARRPP